MCIIYKYMDVYIYMYMHMFMYFFCINIYALYIYIYMLPPGEGNGSPLQYPCLENLMDRGAWWAAVHGVTESRTQLSD